MKNETAPINVVLVEDHTLMRAGIKAMLQGDSRFRVVGEADSLRQAQRVLGVTPCDVALLDLQLPDGDTLDLIRTLCSTQVCAAVVLSMHGEPSYVQRALEMGARGYLLKCASPEHLFAALLAVHSGNLYLHQPVIRGATEQLGNSRSASLSEREAAVLQMVASGQTNESIAGNVGVSVTRIKTHIRSLFTRFGVADRTSLVREATSRGMLSSARSSLRR